MGDSPRFELGTVGALSLSVVSSVSIVICNKALISTLAFNFATTLTSWHLLVTFCSLHVAMCLNFFEHKPFDTRAVMSFGILNGSSIGLLNLSLGFNSVGFYQMTKLAIIPCTVLLETLFLGKKFSRNIQLSLTILLMGVGIATVTDLQLNVVGSVLSLLAVVTTCIAQIMTNTIQKKFKVSSTQLLYQSCPYQAITLFLVGPSVDRYLTSQSVFAFKYTSNVLAFIVLSCLISVSVNFSTFLNILGIFVAIVGMALYSYYCTTENEQQKVSEAPMHLSQAKQSEGDLLIEVENGSDVQKASAWNSNKDLDA
ncbi:UDP-xylose transporter 3 [Heracleum sosnowskyi]|uniref:UDP-xylose transporter 3 n=1 Tax=Heracleum sosnowskyi TaxID=360622 RepID=A0AAD8GX02_9APIA|nr:UDP-xylose transporter 3 [Heracleum sosnowskyi]